MPAQRVLLFASCLPFGRRSFALPQPRGSTISWFFVVKSGEKGGSVGHVPGSGGGHTR